MKDSSAETLQERVNRAKARWLKRVMYHPSVTSTQKCFAYAVVDHLNCVTLDCWPGLAKLAHKLAFKCTRTLHRAAHGLEELGLLRIYAVGSLYHFAPIFLPSDEDTLVPEVGQRSPKRPDKNVPESFLSIYLESASRGPAERSRSE